MPTVAKDIKVTITGANEGAKITVGTGDHATGAVTEDTNVTARNLTTSGTLSFSDVDLSDVHSFTWVSASTRALRSFPTRRSSDLSHTTGSGGVITWSYTVADDAVDYLAQGQTKVETFTISLFDRSEERRVGKEVTITGANEHDKITVGTGEHATGAVNEDTHVT